MANFCLEALKVFSSKHKLFVNNCVYLILVLIGGKVGKSRRLETNFENCFGLIVSNPISRVQY